MPAPYQQKTQEPAAPKTLQHAQIVQFALVTYTDPTGNQNTQLAMVGKENVVLFDNRKIGFGETASPEGYASPWLRDLILRELNGPVPDHAPVSER